MLNRSASLAMSTSVLKSLPGKLDIKRHSPSILYLRWSYSVMRDEQSHVVKRHIFFSKFPLVSLQAFSTPFYIYFIYLFFHGRNRNDLLCIHTNSLDQDQIAVNGIRTVRYRDVKTGSKTTC